MFAQQAHGLSWNVQFICCGGLLIDICEETKLPIYLSHPLLALSITLPFRIIVRYKLCPDHYEERSRYYY